MDEGKKRAVLWLTAGMAVGFCLGRYLPKNEATPPVEKPVEDTTTKAFQSLVTPPSVDQSEVPDESKVQLSPINTEEPTEALGDREKTALAFVREMRDLETHADEIPAPANTELFVKFERENEGLLSLALKHRQPQKAVAQLKKHLELLPQQTSTFARLVQILNGLKRYPEAANYCDTAVSYVRNRQSNLSLDLASNCADAYQGAGRFEEAFDWHLYCFEFGKDDQRSELQKVHSAAIVVCCEKLGDLELKKKYRKVSCEAGNKKDC